MCFDHWGATLISVTFKLLASVIIRRFSSFRELECCEEQSTRQLKIPIPGHKRREEHRPSDKATPLKVGRDLAISLHAIAEKRSIDCENTGVLQLGFRTWIERKYAEALAISTHSLCVNRNDGADFGDHHWKTNIPKAAMLVHVTATAAHDVTEN